MLVLRTGDSLPTEVKAGVLIRLLKLLWWLLFGLNNLTTVQRRVVNPLYELVTMAGLKERKIVPPPTVSFQDEVTHVTPPHGY